MTGLQAALQSEQHGGGLGHVFQQERAGGGVVVAVCTRVCGQAVGALGLAGAL